MKKNIISMVFVLCGSSYQAFAKDAPKEMGPKNERISQEEAELVRNHIADAASARFKPGKGLEIKTADGRFNITTRLRAQFLYDYTINNSAGATDNQNFQIRRARLQFVGNMWGRHNKYKVEFAFSPQDENLQPLSSTGSSNVTATTPLLSWYMSFDYLRDATLRIGQYKIPYSRQRVISSGNLQMVDRSIANGEFTLDRDLGFDFRSKDLLGLNLFKYYAGVYIGEGRNSSNKTNGAGDLGLMYLGRIEFLPLGIFKGDYSESDMKRSDKFRVTFGFAYSYLQNVQRDKGIIGNTLLNKKNLSKQVESKNAAGDMLIKYYGFSFQTEWFWREFTNITSGKNGWGAMVQMGYLFPRTGFEIAGRFGVLRSLGNLSTINDDNEVGGALSYYFAHHNLKIQADLFHLYTYKNYDAGDSRLRIQMQAAF